MEKCCKQQCPYWHREVEVYITHDNRKVERDLSRCLYRTEQIIELQKRECEGDDSYPVT